MCIIMYSPANKYLSDATIKEAFLNNPDGAGVMYQLPSGNIKYIKGLMTIEELLAAYKAIPKEYEKAIHCRIATSGAVSKQCCHPFTVTKDLKVMTRLSNTIDCCLMHNGVFTEHTPKEGLKSPYSDTMIFTSKIVAPLKASLHSYALQVLLSDYISNSKLLIFQRGQEPLMLGTWVQDAYGNYFTNTSYKPFVWSAKDYYSNYNYDTGYDDVWEDNVWDESIILSFELSALDEDKAQDKAWDVLKELDMQHCYPDYDTAFETLGKTQNGTYTFDVAIVKAPKDYSKLPKVLYPQDVVAGGV